MQESAEQRAAFRTGKRCHRRFDHISISVLSAPLDGGREGTVRSHPMHERCEGVQESHLHSSFPERCHRIV